MLSKIQKLITIVSMLIITNNLLANDETTTISVNEVLILDRIEIPIAAFDAKNNYKEILNFETIDVYDLLPSESGAEIKVSDNPQVGQKLHPLMVDMNLRLLRKTLLKFNI